MGKATYCAAAAVSSALLCAGPGALAGNLIANGNFAAGDVGFTSAYQYRPDDIAAGTYWIGSDPTSHGWRWASFGAPDGGNLMMVNGGWKAGMDVWRSAPIAVTPDTKYVFSVWVASNDPERPASLALDINGVPEGSAFQAPATAGDWSLFTVDWNSGASSSAELALSDENIAYYGNDFALSGISFAASPPGGGTQGAVTLPEPGSLGLIGAGLIAVATMRRAGLGRLNRTSLRHQLPG
jgi:hypothetical protein